MMEAVIIDDEVNNSNYLYSLLQEHLPHVTILGVSDSVSTGIDLINKTNPKLVFLDIELQTSTGFDLLTKITPINFSVIFTTAHERYALKAIKFAALDFLLKPVDVEELKLAVNKAVKQQDENDVTKKMEVFLTNLVQKDKNKKIAVPMNNGIVVHDVNKILYCQADGPYTQIRLPQEKVLSSRHLKEYETLLSDFNFFRIHKSYLVNLEHIKQYVRTDGGYVIMSNGDKVDVSDKKKTELIGKLSEQVIFPL